MTNQPLSQGDTTAMSFYVIVKTHEFNGRHYPELMLPETTRFFWSSDFQLLSEHAWHIQGQILASLAGE
jgi:hypothetical protein